MNDIKNSIAKQTPVMVAPYSPVRAAGGWVPARAVRIVPPAPCKFDVSHCIDQEDGIKKDKHHIRNSIAKQTPVIVAPHSAPPARGRRGPPAAARRDGPSQFRPIDQRYDKVISHWL